MGRSISGILLFLAPPTPESKAWRLAVDMGGLIHLDLSFTEFPWRALRQELFVPVIEGEAHLLW